MKVEKLMFVCKYAAGCEEKLAIVSYDVETQVAYLRSEKALIGGRLLTIIDVYLQYIDDELNTADKGQYPLTLQNLANVIGSQLLQDYFGINNEIIKITPKVGMNFEF